jgi:hypothetical protein
MGAAITKKLNNRISELETENSILQARVDELLKENAEILAQLELELQSHNHSVWYE